MSTLPVRSAPRNPEEGALPDSRRSDVELMERVRDGDRAAFGALVARHWAPLTDYAAGFAGGVDEGEDVVQEVFVQVWRSRADWTSSGTVTGFLFRITRNLALNRIESQRAREDRERRPEVVFRHYGAPPPTPHDAFEARRLRAVVDEAVSELPPRQREVFVLARIHGLSHREIAGTLEISPQTVANQMSAALAKLQAMLAHLP